MRDQDRIEAVELFSKELWLDHVDSDVETIGGQPFLTFGVTRNAPVYTHALQRLQTVLSDENSFKGRIGIQLTDQSTPFPESIESSILEGMIGRTSRAISEGESAIHGIGFIPFHNREENKVIQPATQLILGRRGVGKSTLIGKAVSVLRRRNTLCVVVDLEAYARRDDSMIISDLFGDILDQLDKELLHHGTKVSNIQAKVAELAIRIKSDMVKAPQAILEIKRLFKEATSKLETDLFIFLDDFHLISHTAQPNVLAALHGAVKGARGWLKIAGLTTLVKYYDQGTRAGLQVPGDAQIISLDLTLTDPQAAETHLRSILKNYLMQVGVDNVPSVISDVPFRRLVWANAGVVRDFLEMFSIALVSARRARRSRVALSDVNLSIGELGKKKISDLEQDARNESDTLKEFLSKLEEFCLNTKKVNAFLVKQETSEVSKTVQVLSDLRVVHLLHQSITPHRAGERYEAYMLDYSLFVGFRRKRNIREIHPKHGLQFQVKELRTLPVFTQA